MEKSARKHDKLLAESVAASNQHNSRLHIKAAAMNATWIGFFVLLCGGWID